LNLELKHRENEKERERERERESKTSLLAHVKTKKKMTVHEPGGRSYQTKSIGALIHTSSLKNCD
jgi:uncharacterized linocin/CFP29 family protein